MKHAELESLQVEDNMDASTKVSTTEQTEITLEEKMKVMSEKMEKDNGPPSSKMIKTNMLIRELNKILSTEPENAGKTAIETWRKIGPFDLQTYVDTLKITLDERTKVSIDLGW